MLRVYKICIENNITLSELANGHELILENSIFF